MNTLNWRLQTCSYHVNFLWILLLVFVSAGIPARTAHCQLTSSKNVVLLPFVAPSPDTTLAADLYKTFLSGIRQLRSGAITIQTELYRKLERDEITEILSQTTSMGTYATRVGAAFLICGAARRLQDGEVQVSLALYGTDDRRMLASDTHIYTNEEKARTGILEMAREYTHPRSFTPSDTPILYSLLIPGTGQLSLGEPEHALLSVGLIVAVATLSPKWSSEDPPWRRKQLRKRKTLLIVSAWACNVLDTVVLCLHRLRRVDAQPFFSIIEVLSAREDGSFQTLLGIRLRW